MKQPFPIKISAAERSDAAFIRILSREVFGRYGPYEEMLPHWFLSGIARTLVAVVNNELAGYVMLGMERHASFRVTELLAIAVVPHHCHCGVGDRLMRAVIKTAEESGVDMMILHTGTHNLPAQSLFKKHGFMPEGVTERFYEGGQSALMMRKEMVHC